MQKHLMRLPDRCLIHKNALQYLIIRERQKSYALCKLEVLNGGKQRLVTLSLIKKNDLLCSSQSTSKNPENKLSFVREHLLKAMALVIEMKESQNPIKKVVTSELEREIKHKKTREKRSSRDSSHTSERREE